jgi:hypothetical protein
VAGIDFTPNAAFKRTASSDAKVDLIAAMYAFFSTDSTLWQVDNALTGDSFTVSPVSVSLNFQMNFRPGGPGASDVLIAMDYDGTITDPTTLAGAGDLSTEFIVPFVAGATRLHFFEYADAFTIVSLDLAGIPFYERVIHAGVIAIPLFDTDPANEFDGVGLGCGNVDVGGSQSGGLWNSANVSGGDGGNELHVGPSSWVPVENSTAFKTPGIGDTAIGGRVQPIPQILQTNPGDRPIAVAKYWFKWDQEQAPLTIIRDATNSKEMVATSHATGSTADALHGIPFGFDPTT